MRVLTHYGLTFGRRERQGARAERKPRLVAARGWEDDDKKRGAKNSPQTDALVFRRRDGGGKAGPRGRTSSIQRDGSRPQNSEAKERAEPEIVKVKLAGSTKSCTVACCGGFIGIRPTSEVAEISPAFFSDSLSRFAFLSYCRGSRSWSMVSGRIQSGLECRFLPLICTGIPTAPTNTRSRQRALTWSYARGYAGARV